MSQGNSSSTAAQLSMLEESRDTSAAVEVPDRIVDSRNKLNDLTAKEWMPETVSVWTQKGLGANHPDARIERMHPAPYSFTDVSRLIRFFTKEGGTVLDPFVGVGSTLKACAIEKRHGIGIELYEDFATLAQMRLHTEASGSSEWSQNQQILIGDARIELAKLPDESVDLVVTSPPYWSILKKKDHKAKETRESHGLVTQYGDDTRDLGNLDNYAEFLSELGNILSECVRTLRPYKHMCLVVSDFRDKSKYVMFHADLAAEMERRGMEMKGLTTLYQRHKRIFPYGYPYSFVPNIHNQFILILQKSGEVQ